MRVFNISGEDKMVDWKKDKRNITEIGRLFSYYNQTKTVITNPHALNYFTSNKNDINMCS